MATDELAEILGRRTRINESEEEPKTRAKEVFNPYTEFKEFSMKEIKAFKKTFEKYDVDRDKFIDIMELKLMMEKIGSPQTHIGLKEMIKEVDEDNDGMISFREFLLIFRKAMAGELTIDSNSGLYDLYRNVSEVDVDKEGVGGAKNFFQAKIEAQTADKKFEEEIIQEQEERKKELENAKIRKAAFKNKANMFENAT